MVHATYTTHHIAEIVCPSGQTFQTATKTCYSPQKCNAMAPLGAGVAKGGGFAVCNDGCEFRSGGAQLEVTFGDGTKMTPATSWTPTGQPCAANAPPPPDVAKKQECTTLPGGISGCLKPDGQHCYTASTGKQICWRPGEVGEKNDGPVKQKTDPGNQPIPPNLQLPSGDSLVQQGTPTTTTVNNNTSNTSSTTTTTNYKTANGTNASGGSSAGDAGEPGDGSGSGENGEGTGASGGANCEEAPVVTGDAALGMVATQSWATRCAVEAGNAAKVTGVVDDCTQPFSVEGTNANALKLRAMRKQLCKDDANGNGKSDWTEKDGTEEGGTDNDNGNMGIGFKGVSSDLLDLSGFGSGGSSCPSLGSIDVGFFGVWNFDAERWWCNLVSIMRAVILLVGAFTAIRILMGE